MHEKQISLESLSKAQPRHANTGFAHDLQLWVSGEKNRFGGLLNRTRGKGNSRYSLQKYQKSIIRNLLMSFFGKKNLVKLASTPDDPQMEGLHYSKLQFTPAFWTTHARAPRLYR